MCVYCHNTFTTIPRTLLLFRVSWSSEGVRARAAGRVYWNYQIKEEVVEKKKARIIWKIIGFQCIIAFIRFRRHAWCSWWCSRVDQVVVIVNCVSYGDLCLLFYLKIVVPFENSNLVVNLSKCTWVSCVTILFTIMEAVCGGRRLIIFCLTLAVFTTSQSESRAHHKVKTWSNK